MQCSVWIQHIVSCFFEYSTPKIVQIKSKKIGVLSRLVQICVLSYVVGYILVYKKGYQEVDNVVSAVTTKVKGNLLTNYSDSQLINVTPPIWRNLYRRVWDVTDLVVPPSQSNAFFITTNLVITPNQTKSECPELPGVSPCTQHSDCTQGTTSILLHGVVSGTCDMATNTCMIHAWCPLEQDILPLGDNKAVLEGTSDFTVLIKNQINFPLFLARRSNLLEDQNTTYLESCLNSDSQPYCPVFRLGDIVERSGESYQQMAVRGGVINIDIRWECDLDWDFLTYCRPSYSFTRLDSPSAKITPGWNFRHADYFNQNRRTLVKSYGIEFVITVDGEARRFNMVPCLINLGAGLALLGVVTVICDILVLYCHKHRKYYKQVKFLEVEGEDPFLVN